MAHRGDEGKRRGQVGVVDDVRVDGEVHQRARRLLEEQAETKRVPRVRR